MQKLIASNPNTFPLRASLFYKYGTEQRTTWDYLARDGKQRAGEIVADMQSYGCNAMTFLIYNMVAKENMVNPFLGCPTASQVMAGQQGADIAELAKWEQMLQPGKDPNVWLIPCLFCGDDRATTNNTQFHEFFLRYAIPWLNPYSKAYLISTEASKSMSFLQMSNLIAFIKRFTDKPVGVHNQGTNIPVNADFLAYEFSFCPWEGNNYSVSDVINEAANVLRSYPKYVWFEEMNMDNEGQRAKEQSRALRDFARSEPRIIGIPMPL